MSTAFSPKDSNTSQQALKVQELVVSSFDTAMYSVTSSTVSILVNEPVDKVYLAVFKDDSANTVTQFAQTSISVVDSAGGTSGKSVSTGLAVSDRGVITIAGIAALDANDNVTVKYTVLQHLA